MEEEQTDLWENIGKLINVLSHHLRRQSVVPAENDALTPMQRHILSYILMASLCRDIYQKDVEEEFQIRRSTATGILQLMERKGFICRESVQKDARCKRIIPTPKAEAFRARIVSQIGMVEKRLKEGISQKDLLICTAVLQKMLWNLTRLRDEKQKEEEETNE